MTSSYYEKIGMEVRCINSEIPFDLPETWCWCRLGTLFAHNTGKALNSSDSAGTPMTYITTSNLYWDRFELDSLKEMPFTDSEIDKCTVTKGDLLVCEGGDIGRSAIWMFAENIRIVNNGLACEHGKQFLNGGNDNIPLNVFRLFEAIDLIKLVHRLLFFCAIK